MTKYLKKFEERSEYNAYKDSSAFITPNVSAIVEEIESGEDGVVFNPYVHDYSKDYLTTVAKSNGTIVFIESTSNTVYYSTDNGATWSDLTQNPSVNVSSGDKVLWKGNYSQNSDGIGQFTEGTATFDVEGNAMSLLFGDNFIGQTSLINKRYAFTRLFYENTKLESAENLSLPATTLDTLCYGAMFKDCTSLTTAPSVLPAMTLADGCYQQMFDACTSLTTTPELPATTLAISCYYFMFLNCTSLTTAPQLLETTLTDYCYLGMFQGCTSLTTAPQLPATTLANGCYQNMFYGCSRLNSITCLATDISASDCTSDWVNGVAASGTFTKAASMSSWSRGINGIPTNWTVQDAS